MTKALAAAAANEVSFVWRNSRTITRCTTCHQNQRWMSGRRNMAPPAAAASRPGSSTTVTTTASPIQSLDHLHHQQQQRKRQRVPLFSSVAFSPDDNDGFDSDVDVEERYQVKQTKESEKNSNKTRDTSTCSSRLHDPYEPLPKPLPEPRFTFLRRVLNPVWVNDENAKNNPQQHSRRPLVVALDSPRGRKRLLRSLAANAAVPYLALQNHFTNQSDPAYCGITTLLVVLNAFSVDPLRRWKGGWRYFGNEDVLLDQCCLDPERVKRIGINLTQFAQFASCQGLNVTLKRPQVEEENVDATTASDASYSLQDFRADILNVLTESPPKASASMDDDDDDTTPQNLSSLLVASYSRSHIGQTGDGHFSPLAAYDAATDSVLILDVARFKYPPYWIDVAQLYHAMTPLDARTQQSRGWFVLEPPTHAYYEGSVIRDEAKRPAEKVPKVGDDPSCPAQAVKVEFCPNNSSSNESDGDATTK
mmetsp:Transcript_10409/g.28771  ORF Transcript_10409/g.28771 Transcript_10409/m.28771 type:complete len:477 (-) Transcript_10409:1217-2647(-)